MKIDLKNFFEILKKNGISFFTGVPDSLLKDFCSYVTDNVDEEHHIINSNEGACIALASGYHLSTGKTGLVYMQNSGLGNSVNPLMSLADSEVYSIPMILLIGWRGEPGKKDEPQHRKQGRVMLKLLDSIEIPYSLINSSTNNVDEILTSACKFAKEKNSPYAIVISEDTFEKYDLKEVKTDFPLVREDVIKIILESLDKNDIIVSTTGKTGREICEYRENNKQSHKNDFLTIGSMGHCSQVALGIALMKKDKQVYIIDGDGSVIMHMGSLGIIGTNAPKNLKHIIINNGAHESVGGQPTVGFKIDFRKVSEACGYKNVSIAENHDAVIDEFLKLKKSSGPSLLEIRVRQGARKNLGRPTTTPVENKKEFMKFLSDSN